MTNVILNDIILKEINQICSNIYVTIHLQHRINIETHASSRCVDINILVEGSEHTRELRSMDGVPISSDPKNSKSYDSSISAATIHAVEANLHSMSR